MKQIKQNNKKQDTTCQTSKRKLCIFKDANQDLLTLSFDQIHVDTFNQGNQES